MKKRIWSLLTLFVLVSMFQVTVLAENISERANINVRGTKITSENAADVLGDGSVSYDVDNDILTLNGANISVNDDYGIYTEGDLTIVLKGNNTIVSSTESGIHVKGNLTIKGEGFLEVDGYGYGIYSYNDMIIGERANVTVEMIAAPAMSYGIYSYNNLTIGDSATVTVTGGYGPERSCGIYAISDLTIGGNAVVNTTGSDNNTSYDAFNDSYGIRTTNLIINGGTLTATAGKSNAASDGIFTQNLEITAGTVTATGNTAYKGPSNGIEATNSLTISGGTVKAVGGDTESDASCGIRAAGTMTVTGGLIYAESGKATDTHGIETDVFNISGGDIIASAINGSNSNRGIQAFGALTISGGSVEAYSDDDAAYSYGLQGNNVEISSGYVIVSSGNANVSNGIWAFESVNIADSTVDITSGGVGINVPFGSVNIDCTEVTAIKNYPTLVGTTVKINAEGAYGICAGIGLTLSERLNIGKPLEVTVGEESYWILGDAEGNVVKDVTIAPLTYKVIIIIPGLTSTSGTTVPAGQSVNDTYCELWKIEDFSEFLNTNREGYIFAGWYTDEDCTDGNEFSFDDKITSDMTVYAKWEEEPATQVYYAFVVLQDALVSRDLETLETAVEVFYNVVDTFNELGEDELIDLALLMNVEDGEAAFAVVFSDWFDANVILSVANAYSTFLENPNEETSASYIEMIDGYDEMYGGDRALIGGFIADIDKVYEKAEDVIDEAEKSESKEESKDEKDEKDKTTTADETVRTGDRSNLWLWLSIIVVSGIVFIDRRWYCAGNVFTEERIKHIIGKKA